MLVIIDLQDTYSQQFIIQNKKFNEMLQKILQRIEVAEKNEEPIINLTHVHDGCTIPEIVEEINKRKNHFYIGKNSWDGSSSIHALIKRKNLNANSIELCGAFSDCCVLATWRGLKAKGYNVLPVDKDLVIRTVRDRKPKYPKGYFKRENNGMEIKHSRRKP